MSQEANSNTPNNRQDGGNQKNRPNRNPKRHYREIGDAGSANQDRQVQGGQSDGAQQNQRGPGPQKRQGGNQPPRNRRPRNRKPAQANAGGPVERKEAQPNRDNRNRQNNQPAEQKAQTNENVNVARGKTSGERPSDQDNRQNRQQRTAKPRNTQENRNNRWEKRVKQEETAEDIRRDNERIEKEIWLDIAGIHTIKLDF